MMNRYEAITLICGVTALRFILQDNTNYLLACAGLGLFMGYLRGTKK